MKNFFKKGLSIVAISGLILAGCGGAKDVANEVPAGDVANNQGVTITMGETPWTSTVPPTYVAKQLLEDMGYQVKIQKADAGVVFTGLAAGDIDVFMDAWLPDMHKNYMEKYGDKITDTAVSYPDGEMGWVVPKYMEDINSIDDLKGKEDLFEGKVYGIEEGAGMTMTSHELIKDYGLNIDYSASSESGMLAQAKRLIQQEKPVIFLGWRPHTMFLDFDIKVLEDQKEFFKTSEVHVLTNKDFAEKAPEAFNFLSKWNISVSDIEKMISDMDQGAKPEEVAKEWIEANPDKVKEMTGK